MGKCKCWREEHAARPFASGRCSGTKELDLCDCGGDETKCDFYPERRRNALGEMGKLKPCPFCGERLEPTKRGEWRHPDGECYLAFADSEYGCVWVAPDEIDKWNRRAAND